MLPSRAIILDTLDHKGSRYLSQLVAQAKREFGRISVENDEPSIKGVLYKMATELICTYGSPGKAVLVFLPGINEISQLHEMIEKAALEKSLSVSVYILHSQILHEE